ncbi:MAG TPA: rhomboid family intramembrane serine protease [Streptosporangiaceae bacterium]|nr:rhomboid family intramembrane serine protease [Streptosporangiaceae bacterium]
MTDDFPARRATQSEGLATHATRAASAVVVVGFVLAVMWVLEIVAYMTDGYIPRTFGIHAHDITDLPHVFTAPFLHAGFDHLASNTVPFAILGFLAGLRGITKFLAMNVIVMVVGGLGVWILGPETVPTVGASILIFGYFGYLAGRGLFERRLIDILIAVVVGVLYGTAIAASLLPNNHEISWQGHLFGLIGGLLAAWTLRRRDATGFSFSL